MTIWQNEAQKMIIESGPDMGYVHLRKNGAKRFLNWNGDGLNTVERPVLQASSVTTMAAERAILCALFEEFSEPDEIGINTCLIRYVTVTALQSRR